MSKGAALAYKPLGLAASVTGGLIAGMVVQQVWKRVIGEAPEATDANRGWGEIILAAAIQGAIFAVVNATIGGATGLRRLTGAWRGTSRSPRDPLTRGMLSPEAMPGLLSQAAGGRSVCPRQRARSVTAASGWASVTDRAISIAMVKPALKMMRRAASRPTRAASSRHNCRSDQSGNSIVRSRPSIAALPPCRLKASDKIV